ncbi:sugar transporter [Actinobacillus indolicus]|uniref:Probable sugar efflux transporter n=1 Tax=Actinobacillus indolicus TaxID=51049 RepID=A0A4P7CKW7_9PAST|nr:sugar transporter [Actinobacillus indolicus]QBQ64624.1 sugar transporter [Actinobacillus indolicus]
MKITKQIYRKLSFLRVFAFALAAFIFNTTEFIPVALLSDIAQGFGMDVSHTGLMITVYAWIVSLMSLPFMLLTANLERKELLIKLFLVFIISHILSVFAWDFWVLLISRIGIAFTHAIFWAITASLVIRVAPKDKKQQALGLLALGSALAMVLGLPLGRMIGQAVGWRITFAIIGFIAFIVMLMIWKLLPNLPSKNAGSLASLPILVKRPALIGLYIAMAIVIAGHFTSYSYIEPFMVQIAKMSAHTATLLLLIFGLSGVVASFLFGRIHPKHPNLFLLSGLLFIIFAQLLLLPLNENSALMFGIVFFWGIGISGISLALQMRVLQLAPDATDVATAIYSGIYNIGIGGGALIGNQVMAYLGLNNIGFIGALLVIVGMLVLIFGHSRQNGC